MATMFNKRRDAAAFESARAAYPIELCHFNPEDPVSDHLCLINDTDEEILFISNGGKGENAGLWTIEQLKDHGPGFAAVVDQFHKYRTAHPEGDTMPVAAKSSKKITPWTLVEFALDARCPRSLVYGPPGTGKTMSAYLWAKANNFECLSTTLTEDTPMTELRGHFVLKGSDFVWHDGLIARAWRMSLTQPVMVILNEIDHASGDTSTFLHNALDDPQMARLDLPNDETIVPKAGNLLYVATMNGVPEDLSEALRDRFPVKIAIPEPNPKAIAALPTKLQTLGSNLSERPGLTLRGLYEFGRLLESGASQSMAARLIFGDAANDILNALKLAE